MIELRVVRRYAAALFGAASQRGVVDRVESDLGLVSYVVETSPALLKGLTSPLVPGQRKREILRQIFEGKVHEVTLSYLCLLVGKRREEAIPLTEAEYVRLANEARGIATAHVVSAVDLVPEEETALAQALSHATGKTVVLERSVDPELIGGVLVKIGDTVIDGSIRGQLEALREKLLE